MKHSALLKKVAAIITLIAVVMSFCSCTQPLEEETSFSYSSTTQEKIPGGTLSVPYNSADSMNPYFCTSVLNNAAMSLVYSPLYKLDASFSPVRVLAENESITGLELRVYLADNVLFSDGSALTGEDVVYSFECAKNSYVYGDSLGFITSCSSQDGNCIVFGLRYSDESILNVLTFPIVKKGTADTAESLPTGSGYYKFYDDGIRLSLQSNLKYSGVAPDIGNILLTDVRGNVTPENLVTTGELDFCYTDLADANIVGVNCSTTSVYLNNLVYLGVNHSNVNLMLASFRQALSYGINRKNAVENAFMGYARSACVPFNTSWSRYTKSGSYTGANVTGDTETAQELLSQYGFGKDGTALNLTLVCSESNSFIRSLASCIAADLTELNINIDIVYLSSEALEKTVKLGEYDLYIGEVKIPANMDISGFFTEGNDCSIGINFENCTCDEAYFSFLAGEQSLDTFIARFNADMPFIPLAYRNARFCYTRDITSEVSVTESAVFGDINIWTFSENVY